MKRGIKAFPEIHRFTRCGQRSRPPSQTVPRRSDRRRHVRGRHPGHPRIRRAGADDRCGHLSVQPQLLPGHPAHSYIDPTDVAGREVAAGQWVTDAGHTLVWLSDADLESPAKLAAVDVVILPYTWAMNEDASLTLRSWVKQGGGLISVLTSPRVYLENGVWKLWVWELNYEAWEWGPLSEAYQMMFDNDPWGCQDFP